MTDEDPREALARATRNLKHFTADVTTTRDEDGLRVSLSGYLDGDSANSVITPLSSLVMGWSGAPKLVVDLSKLEYISSLGIGMLTTIAVSAHRRSIALTLCAPQPSVLHVLELLGIPRYIPVVMDEKGCP
ncbi:MAG TPA: STAS domain-containing protein [Spirochaetia bacterium]